MNTRFLLTTVSFPALKRTAFAALAVVAMATLAPSEAMAGCGFTDPGACLNDLKNGVVNGVEGAVNGVGTFVTDVGKDLHIIQDAPPPKAVLTTAPAVAAGPDSATILAAANSIQNLGIVTAANSAIKLSGAQIDALTRIVASGGGNLISNDGSTIVASGGGNVVANKMVIAALGDIGLTAAVKAQLVDALTSTTGGGLQARSNAVQSQFISGMDISLTQKASLIAQLPGGNGIVASGGGNLIGNAGGILVASGGGNVIQVGSVKVISNDGGSIVAAGGGNVASKGVSLVSDSGGTLVGNAGGTLVGNAGGTLVGNAGGTLIGNAGGALVASGGGNFSLSDAGKSALVGPSGGTLIGNASGTLIGNASGTVVANDGASAVARVNSLLGSPAGSGLMSTAANLALGRVVMDAGQTKNDVMAIAVKTAETANAIAGAGGSTKMVTAAPPPPTAIQQFVATATQTRDSAVADLKAATDQQAVLVKQITDDKTLTPDAKAKALQATAILTGVSIGQLQQKVDKANADLTAASAPTLAPTTQQQAAATAAATTAQQAAQVATNLVGSDRLVLDAAIKSGNQPAIATAQATLAKDTVAATSAIAVLGAKTDDVRNSGAKTAVAFDAAGKAVGFTTDDGKFAYAKDFLQKQLATPVTSLTDAAAAGNIAKAQTAATDAQTAAAAAEAAFKMASQGVIRPAELGALMAQDQKGMDAVVATANAKSQATQALLAAGNNGDPNGTVAAALKAAGLKSPGDKLNDTDLVKLREMAVTDSKAYFYQKDLADGNRPEIQARSIAANNDLTSANAAVTALQTVAKPTDPAALATLNAAITTATVVQQAAQAKFTQLDADARVVVLQAALRDGADQSDATKKQNQAELTRLQGVSAANSATLAAIVQNNSASTNPASAFVSAIAGNSVGKPVTAPIATTLNSSVVVNALQNVSIMAAATFVAAEAKVTDLTKLVGNGGGVLTPVTAPGNYVPNIVGPDGKSLTPQQVAALTAPAAGATGVTGTPVNNKYNLENQLALANAGMSPTAAAPQPDPAKVTELNNQQVWLDKAKASVTLADKGQAAFDLAVKNKDPAAAGYTDFAKFKSDAAAGYANAEKLTNAAKTAIADDIKARTPASSAAPGLPGSTSAPTNTAVLPGPTGAGAPTLPGATTPTAPSTGPNVIGSINGQPLSRIETPEEIAARAYVPPAAPPPVALGIPPNLNSAQQTLTQAKVAVQADMIYLKQVSDAVAAGTAMKNPSPGAAAQFESDKVELAARTAKLGTDMQAMRVAVAAVPISISDAAAMQSQLTQAQAQAKAGGVPGAVEILVAGQQLQAINGGTAHLYAPTYTPGTTVAAQIQLMIASVAAQPVGHAPISSWQNLGAIYAGLPAPAGAAASAPTATTTSPAQTTIAALQTSDPKNAASYQALLTAYQGAAPKTAVPAVPIAVAAKITDGVLVRPETPNGVMVATAPTTPTNVGAATPVSSDLLTQFKAAGSRLDPDVVAKLASKLTPEQMKVFINVETGKAMIGSAGPELTNAIAAASSEVAAAKVAQTKPGTPVPGVAVANATATPTNVGAATPTAPASGTPTQPAAPVTTAPVGAPVATTDPVPAPAPTPGSKPAPSIGEIDRLKPGGPVMTGGPVQIQPVKEIVRGENGSVDRGAVIPEQARFDYEKKLAAEKLAAGNARIGLMPVATPDNPPLARPINDGLALRTINDKPYIIGANRDANGCSTDLQACRITLDPKLIVNLKAALKNVPGQQTSLQKDTLAKLGTLLDGAKKGEPLILTGKDADSFLEHTPKFIAMHPKADQALGLTAFVKAATPTPTVAVANPSGNATPPTASLSGNAGTKEVKSAPAATTPTDNAPAGRDRPRLDPVADAPAGRDKPRLDPTANASSGDHAAPGKDVGEKPKEKTVATGNPAASPVGHANPGDAADKVKMHESNAKPGSVPEKSAVKPATAVAPAGAALKPAAQPPKAASPSPALASIPKATAPPPKAPAAPPPPPPPQIHH